MKTAELEGSNLAEWVARANGWKVERDGDHPEATLICWDPTGGPFSFGEYGYRPDLNWVQGGPILDKLMGSGEWAITPWEFVGFGAEPGSTVMISNYMTGSEFHEVAEIPVKLLGSEVARMDFMAPTLLKAACRAFVASKFGDTVPDEAP